MITRFDVDGVPGVFAKVGGPMKAGLAFRVGFADEPLPKRGITHLIEHLALHSTGVADYHYNGATGVEHTYFHMQGSESDIVAFLNGVCASLLEPPLHRLPVEKEILRTEAASRHTAANEMLPMWRHGARDYGLASFPEWGLAALSPEDLHAWVARYFVRQNAVLWIAGSAVPAGLKLALPEGARQPIPATSSALPAKPAYFPGSSGAVVWDAVVRREAAAGIFAGVLEREMLRALRQEGGLSYTVQTDYDPRADGSAVITAVADALPDKQGAVLGGFVDVLAGMRVGRIDPAEVATVVNQRCDALGQAEDLGARLPGQAFNLLIGWPVQSLEEAVAEARAVTHGDVVRVAATAYADGLLMTPSGTTAEWAGYTAAPTSSDHPVQGQAYPCIEDPQTRLILGDHGVSVADEDQTATVRFDGCAVALAWPDGARQLIGRDGIVVRVEPTMYAGVPAAVHWLDAKIPHSLRVDMPARDPSRIPTPELPTWPTAQTGAARPGRAGPILTLIALGPVALFSSFLALLLGLSILTDKTDLGVTIGLTVFFTLVTAAAVWGLTWSIRRLAKR